MRVYVRGKLEDGVMVSRWITTDILQPIKISSKKRLSGKIFYFHKGTILTRFLSGKLQARTLKFVTILFFVRWRVDGLLLIMRWRTTEDDLSSNHRFSSSCCIIKFVGTDDLQDGREIANNFGKEIFRMSLMKTYVCIKNRSNNETMQAQNNKKIQYLLG